MTRASFVRLSVLALMLAACSSPGSSSPADATESEPPASTAPSTAAVVPLEPGRLDPGVTYVLPDFGGLAVNLAVEGWLATLPNGGDVIATGGRTVAYFLRPQTVISPDETGRLSWPTDVAEAKAALNAARGVTVESAEPITIAGIETELLRVSASGQSEAAPLLQTGSGEVGLSDGDTIVILIPIEGEVVMLTVEREGDYAAALEEGQVLLDGLLFSE